MLDKESLKILFHSLERLDSGFSELPEFAPHVPGEPRIEEILSAVADRLQDNYPYFHPLYAGQMLKPPHPVARLAYSLAQWINPNNHALDGGRATSAMEREAVAGIATMFGWGEHLGHLCGGGTMANLEALWVAGQLAPGKRILAGEQAHYTHGRISGVLQLPFTAVACDARGRMDLNKLREERFGRQCWRGGCHDGHHSDRIGRPTGGNSGPARKTWLPCARRCGLWRLFWPGRESCGRSAARIRFAFPGGFHRD